ncbi:1601_t:CDS:2, partial [Cetraspora pellucida]
QQNANKGGNKIAVCKSCIQALGESIAFENKECCVPNKGNLCQQEAILSLEVAEDRKSTQQNVINALVMAQLHSDILRKRKIKQSEFHQNKAKRKHIAEPINEESSSSDQNTDTDNAQITKETDNFEQELDNSNNIIENKIQWEQLITNWIELAEQENKFDSNDDIYINNDHSDLNFSFGGHDIHSADDKDAKWLLLGLFNSSLNAPTMLNELVE